MKKTEINLYFFCLLLLAAFFTGCNDKEKIEGAEQIEYSSDKDERIQRYNLEAKKEQTDRRSPCDTLSLIEFVLDNYTAGTYLVDVDKSLTYNIPEPAVIYYDKNPGYIFGIIASSKEGERLIDTKNIIGFDQSFIDLDSTELGTAFFYLVLFKCEEDKFDVIWESPIPSHGGFNDFKLLHWPGKNIDYIEVNFHYARGSGHINYNYFLTDGLISPPHLLMTYKGINFQRIIANINNDNFPDYYEYVFYDSGNRVNLIDSVAFVWNKRDSIYVNTRNKRQTRPY